MRLVILAVLGVACGGGSQQQKPPGEPAYCGGCRPPTESDKHMFDNVDVEGDLRPGPGSAARNGSGASAGSGATTMTLGSTASLGAGIPHIVIGKPTMSRDAIAKDSVERIVKTHANQLQYCYEKELVITNNMQLEGKVMAAFEIDDAGKVSNSTAIGLTPNVAACMAARIATFEFPKPKSGTVHVVMTIECHPTGG